MNKEKIFNTETLVEAIKEAAAVIAENGGAEIKALFRETNESEIIAHIIIEPYRLMLKSSPPPPIRERTEWDLSSCKRRPTE